MIHYFYLAIWLSLLIFVFLAWFFNNKAKQDERKLLIQQGIDTEKLFNKNSFDSFWLIKLGIVLLGVAAGLIVIVLLVNLGLTGRSDAIYPAILSACIGISLIIAYRIRRKNNEK